MNEWAVPAVVAEKVKLVVSNVTLTDAASTFASTVTKLIKELGRGEHGRQRERSGTYTLSFR